MAHVSAAELAAALKGAHFPATEKDLIKVAQKNGAPEEVIEMLSEMPGEYQTITEVEQAFSKAKKGAKSS